MSLTREALDNWADVLIESNRKRRALEAAAPDMYEALRDVDAHLPIFPSPDITPEDEVEICLSWRDICTLRTALAKAGGFL